MVGHDAHGAPDRLGVVEARRSGRSHRQHGRRSYRRSCGPSPAPLLSRIGDGERASLGFAICVSGAVTISALVYALLGGWVEEPSSTQLMFAVVGAGLLGAFAHCLPYAALALCRLDSRSRVIVVGLFISGPQVITAATVAIDMFEDWGGALILTAVLLAWVGHRRDRARRKSESSPKAQASTNYPKSASSTAD